jgi:hypothetical protein
MKAEPRPSAFGHGPVRRHFYVCGLDYDRLSEFERVPVSRPELRVGCTLCVPASLVCDVPWWTILGVPRDLSG